MSITVTGPDGVELEFPDGTSHETMRAAMAKRYGAPAAPRPERGFGPDMKSALLKTARDFGGSIPFVDKPGEYQSDPLALLGDVGAVVTAAARPLIKPASDALYRAGIRPSVGEGVPELLGGQGFRYRELDQDEAADELTNTALTAAGMIAPTKMGPPTFRGRPIPPRTRPPAPEASPPVPVEGAPPGGGGPPRLTRAREKAVKILRKDIKRSGRPDALATAYPDLTTAEAIGAATSRRLAAMGANPDLSIEARLSGVMGERLAGTPNSVRRASEEALGVTPSEGMNNLRRYLEEERAKATPLYDDLNDNTGAIDSPRLRALMELPDINAALPKAARNVAGMEKPIHHSLEELALPDALPTGARTGSPMGRRPAISSDDAAAMSMNDLEAVAAGDVGGVEPAVMSRNVPSMEVWDHVKRVLDRRLEEELALPGAKQNDSAIVALEHQRRELLKELDQLVPNYASVRQAGASAPSAESAAAMAQRMFAPKMMTNDAFAQEVALMTEPQRRALVNAEMARLETHLGGTEAGGVGGNVNLSLYTTPNYRQRLGMLVGQRDADAFVSRMTQLENARKSAMRLNPDTGSKTFPMSQARESLDADVGGLLPPPEMVTDPVNGARKLVNNILQRAYQDKVTRRLSNPVLEELGDLYLQSPEATLKELEAVTAALRERSILGRTSRLVPRLGRAATPPLRAGAVIGATQDRGGPPRKR